MPEKTRILVVDQDPRGCTEIQQLLANSPLIVMGGVEYDEEALDVASALRPQVVFVAVAEESELALRTLRELANLLPDTPIVTYSGRDDAHSVHQAKALGAREHLTKPLSVEALTTCITRVLSGQIEHDGPHEATMPDHPTATILTVFGPKGGIGRTLIAVNLAASLAEAGLAPVLVDLDSVSGDVARRMKVRVDRSLLDAAQRSGELDELTVDSCLTQHPSGVKVLPAPREPTDWREIDPQGIDTVVTLLAKANQFVIIDTPATFTDLSILAVHRADVVVFLSSLDPSSIEMAESALKMIASSQSGTAKTRLTLNHLTQTKPPAAHDAAATERIQEMCWRSLPYDGSIDYRDEAGRPVVICKPKAKISRSISEMAVLFAEARSPSFDARARGNGSSLLNRVLGNSA